MRQIVGARTVLKRRELGRTGRTGQGPLEYPQNVLKNGIIGYLKLSTKELTFSNISDFAHDYMMMMMMMMMIKNNIVGQLIKNIYFQESRRKK